MKKINKDIKIVTAINGFVIHYTSWAFVKNGLDKFGLIYPADDWVPNAMTEVVKTEKELFNRLQEIIKESKTPMIVNKITKKKAANVS